MPRDGSNIYHRPPGTDGIPNYTIESAKYNANVADVEQDLNTPRPIVAGGTGASSADGALDNLSAEKKKQIVTNWDTMVWMPGSFYAATTASGAAPIPGHAFAGIVYYANATDFVCEATDLSDAANPDQYIRVMADGVWGAWIRLNPNTSSANLGEYTFNNQVTFPPASGQIRFNNATQNSTTEVFISHLSATGVDNSTQITSYLISGVDFIVQDKDEGNKYKVFTTTAAAVLSGGDFRVTAALKIAGIDLVSAQRMLVSASSEAQRVQQRQLIYAAPFDALAYSGMQINGSMEVSQENGTAGSTNSGYYPVDGWYVSKSSTATISFAQTNNPGIFPSLPNYIQFGVTVAGPATPLAGDSAGIYQRFEGYRISRLAWGTANAQPITIGFWVRHVRTGTYSVSVRNIDNTRAYVTTYTQNVSDTAEYKTVTIPGCTDGTWNTINGVGMSIGFGMMGGSASTAPSANVWYTDGVAYLFAPGQVNATQATTDRFRITGVVVLPGIETPSAARSPLIMRPYDQELLTCKRYWQPLSAGFLGVSPTVISNTGGLVTYPFEMRAAPTASPNSGSNSNTGATTIDSLTPISLRAYAVPNASNLAYLISCFTKLDARL